MYSSRLCRLPSVALVFCLVLFALRTLSAADPAMALRERFLGANGLPAESAYAQTHGLSPASKSESFAWQATFKLVYRSADLARLGVAEPVHTDCYFTRVRKFRAAVRAEPVWDGRVYQAGDRLVVAAYTAGGERVFGYVNEESRAVQANDAPTDSAMPDLGGAHYNPFTGQLWRPAPGGEIEERQKFFAPFPLVNRQGEPIAAELKIVRTQDHRFALVARAGKNELTLATCALADQDSAQRDPGYSPILGPGCTMVTEESTTVIVMPGQIAADVIDVRASQLALLRDLPRSALAEPAVRIDGRFDDWRSIPGIADPEGDIASYLQYNPDTDLLQFKVTSDDEHLYFYTRVAGRHGHTGSGRDRYYFYVYIDADRDPTTGYLPTRDDDCYYGVTLGDDCEAQYEFIGGRFVKTFYGFAGRSTEKDVLTGQVTVGPSWYNRQDAHGKLRDGYKVEYIRRAGQISITKDFQEGTSDDIAIAISPDGSQCEMRASLAGFLKQAHGKPLIAAGQTIDLAAGVEAAGNARGNSKWGADSTAIIRGFRIAR